MNLSSDREWFDENGLLHQTWNPTEESSENELLFTAEYYLLGGKGGAGAGSLQMLWFYNSEWLQGKHMSHDNRTGYLSVVGWDDYSIFKAGNRWWLHPRDTVYWGYMKYGWPFYPLLSIVSLANIWSCARTYKKHKAVQPDGSVLRWKSLTTSGKMLALTRNLGADLKLTQKICSWLIRRNPKFKSWTATAKLYFPLTNDKGENHPIVRLIAEKELRGEL